MTPSTCLLTRSRVVEIPGSCVGTSQKLLRTNALTAQAGSCYRAKRQLRNWKLKGARSHFAGTVSPIRPFSTSCCVLRRWMLAATPASAWWSTPSTHFPGIYWGSAYVPLHSCAAAAAVSAVSSKISTDCATLLESTHICWCPHSYPE